MVTRSGSSGRSALAPQGWISSTLACTSSSRPDKIVDHQHRLLVVGHRHLAHAVAEAGPGMLLEEAFLVDAFGMAQKAERPADQVRQDPVGDLAIELRQALLGDALVGPQQAAGIGEPHRQLASSSSGPQRSLWRAHAAAWEVASASRFALRSAGLGRFDQLAEHRVPYQPATRAAAIFDLGRQHRLDPAHALGRRASRPSSGGLVVRSGSSRCHSSRALAAVKPEPHWPTGTSRLPAYSPSTSAPTDLGSTVEGTKPAITKADRSGSTSP